MENNQMNFHKELQRLRKEKGMSQEELGEKLGVSRQTISKWEGAAAYPDMLNLIAICRFFGVTADEMISGSVAPVCAAEAETEELSVKQEKNEFHYEYKSNRTVKGMPLVHINCGLGNYHARGIIAIGNFANGLLSIGLMAKGLLSIGVLSLGIISVGVLALGLFVLGCIGAGLIAVAGIAFGVMTLGGVAIGVVSIGGCAISTHISVGGVALAPVSVGFVVKGDNVIVLENMGQISQVAAESVRELIELRFPNLPFILREWATLIFM